MRRTSGAQAMNRGPAYLPGLFSPKTGRCLQCTRGFFVCVIAQTKMMHVPMHTEKAVSGGRLMHGAWAYTTAEEKLHAVLWVLPFERTKLGAFTLHQHSLLGLFHHLIRPLMARCAHTKCQLKINAGRCC